MRVRVRCYAELNDRLPPGRRQREIEVSLEAAATIADLADAFGIPIREIELALVNGRSCALNHVLQDGDRVSLYPVFEAIDVSPLLRLRERPLREVRFVADAHLGRLARYLRLLGFDTLYENDPGDDALERISVEQGRILLSRDRALLARHALTHGLWIPTMRPPDQLAYVVERLQLAGLFRPFTRCTMCNGTLVRVAKDAIADEVPKRVSAVFDRFWRCAGCWRVYWQGSHYERLNALVGRLERRSERCPGFVRR